MTTVHICDGGPKEWGVQVRRKYGRKWEYERARNRKAARSLLFAWMLGDPTLVEGAIVFSQEYYDPQSVLRVRIGP